MKDDLTARQREREMFRKILDALEALDAVLSAESEDERERANDALSKVLQALEQERPVRPPWLN